MADPGSEPMPLSSLAPGCEAEIAAVATEGEVGRRLADLGFLPGTPVRAVRRAPLGDPCVYELRGYRICLRRGEAELVRVRPRPAGAAAR
jgi:ferrous iron transport protein A